MSSAMLPVLLSGLAVDEIILGLFSFSRLAVLGLSFRFSSVLTVIKSEDVFETIFFEAGGLLAELLIFISLSNFSTVGLLIFLVFK